MSFKTEYGFYGRLTSQFPSQVIVDMTEVCNLACTHCPHPEFKQSEHYQARYLAPELNAKMVDEVRQHGAGLTQYIRYTAEGEPLVHPECYDMIEYAVKQSGVLVSLTTNGTILNEKRIRKLLEAGLDLIDISIDAFLSETYSKIRVSGDLEVTRSNVINMIRLAKKYSKNTKVVVSFIEQPDNIGQSEEFEKFWYAQGAHYVVIRRLHSGAGAVVNIANIIRKQSAAIERKPCLYPWERIVLNPRGFLAYCPQDWVHGSPVADYRNTTIKEEWSGEFYRKLRQAHMDNNFSGFDFCGNCPDWASTRWPDEGRSYADMIQEFKDQAN